MRVRCTSNKGIEKWLTAGKLYDLIKETEFSYIVQDDMGSIAKYSKDRFNKF